MPCDSRLKPGQTIQQRATEVRDVVTRFMRGIVAGVIRPVIDKSTGAIAFDGIGERDRDGVTDACAYRRIMATGSPLAKAAIAKAEALAGRSVNKQTIGGAGRVHSHDGGRTWHKGH